MKIPKQPQVGLESIHLRNSRAYNASPSSLQHRHIILDQVKSHAELNNLIALEDARRLEALSLAF